MTLFRGSLTPPFCRTSLKDYPSLLHFKFTILAGVPPEDKWQGASGVGTHPKPAWHTAHHLEAEARHLLAGNELETSFFR